MRSRGWRDICRRPSRTRGNAGACSEALYGAWLAASFRSAICIHHVIAQQVRQLFDLDHAQTHAAVLPYALAFNAPAIPAAMERLRRALKTDDPPGAIYELNKAMGLPANPRCCRHAD